MRALVSDAGVHPPPGLEALLGVSNLNAFAHTLWSGLVRPGDTCVDATAGNGHDTLFLARACLAEGAAGAVVAFDVQRPALDATRDRVARELSTAQLERCTLVHGCHSRLLDFVQPSSVRLVCFNLGYLPGPTSDKTTVTQPGTTVAALRAACAALAPGGLLCVTCYTGHPGGPEEAAAAREELSTLPAQQWGVTCLQLVNRSQAPHLLLAQRLGG